MQPAGLRQAAVCLRQLVGVCLVSLCSQRQTVSDRLMRWLQTVLRKGRNFSSCFNCTQQGRDRWFKSVYWHPPVQIGRADLWLVEPWCCEWAIRSLKWSLKGLVRKDFTENLENVILQSSLSRFTLLLTKWIRNQRVFWVENDLYRVEKKCKGVGRPSHWATRFGLDPLAF